MKFRILKSADNLYFPQRKTWRGWVYVMNLPCSYGPRCEGRTTVEQAQNDCWRYIQGYRAEWEEVVKEFKI